MAKKPIFHIIACILAVLTAVAVVAGYFLLDYCGPEDDRVGLFLTKAFYIIFSVPMAFSVAGLYCFSYFLIFTKKRSPGRIALWSSLTAVSLVFFLPLAYFVADTIVCGLRHM